MLNVADYLQCVKNYLIYSLTEGKENFIIQVDNQPQEIIMERYYRELDGSLVYVYGTPDDYSESVVGRKVFASIDDVLADMESQLMDDAVMQDEIMRDRGE